GGQHVAVTLLVDALPRCAGFACRLACHALTLATAFVIWRAGHVLLTLLGFMAAPGSGVPLAWVYVAMPVAGAMLAIEALRLLVADLSSLARPA
ncbi:MAG: TRAP transporter small permease subunit, partial [Alphaproteobacteria bacterium]|nr:TRAP transporter small permease subunit [Alphaproteobacteria bacterium]